MRAFFVAIVSFFLPAPLVAGGALELLPMLSSGLSGGGALELLPRKSSGLVDGGALELLPKSSCALSGGGALELLPILSSGLVDGGALELLPKSSCGLVAGGGGGPILALAFATWLATTCRFKKAPVVFFVLVFGFWASAVAGRFVAVTPSVVDGRVCFSPGPCIISVTRFLEGNGG